MSYAVSLSSKAARQFRKLDRKAQVRIAAVIDLLAANPRPPAAKALTGRSRNAYRVRVGDFRVVYEVQDQRLLVLVVRIGHRRDVYRGL